MKHFLPALLLSVGLSASTITPAAAYPVDCAILLCLGGGWPSSAECAHAYTVFIARITPWPIEPPLQIWNCPMHVSLPFNLRQSSQPIEISTSAENGLPAAPEPKPPQHWFRIQGQADIDIFDPAFDFIRSIRVFEVNYQQNRRSDGDCDRLHNIYEGRYGEQGDYIRHAVGPAEVPEASDFEIPPTCTSYRHRSVFVEWYDYAGKYDYEEVYY